MVFQSLCTGVGEESSVSSATEMTSDPGVQTDSAKKPTVFSWVDREAFAKDIDALRAEAEADMGPEDYRHLRKMARWGRAFTGVGYATAWIMPNAFSAAMISTGSMARWAIVAHHVLHKSMDKIEGVPETFTSRGFAKGKRRVLDWLDWLYPAAWEYEHNVLHHFRTSEMADPDLVEENVTPIHAEKFPLWLRYISLGFYAVTWKYTYYAPSSYQTTRRAAARRAERKVVADPATHDARGPELYLAEYDPRTPEGRACLRDCVIPYVAGKFAVIPMAFSLLGPVAVASVAINTAMAEAMTNVHTFCVIATNHVGDDMYRFETQGKGRGEFYLRQIASSVNFRTGGDFNDFMHGYLNYQIEHHLFPDLPPRQYQKLAPKVKAVCEKHRVPYVQESVFKRVKQLVDVVVGKRKMQRA